MELVGTAEVGALVGVSRQRVNELLRSDPSFPSPVAELAAGRIWQRTDIERWMEIRDRARKGPQVEELNGIRIVTPVRFADAQPIAESIANAAPTAIDLRSADAVVRRRLIDFVSGAMSVGGGSLERYINRVYLCRPPDVILTKGQLKALSERFSS